MKIYDKFIESDDVMNTWNQLHDVQPNITQMLLNSIRKERIAHAYLFEGLRGTRKKAASLLFSKKLFCKQPIDQDPCNECTDCRRIDSGNHPDVHIISPDGQSLKKEQIRNLQREFTKTGVESNRKIYIIEHADKMTVEAANSLLKFLEEPNQLTTALLLTERLQRIIPTIKSRCQIIHFKPLSEKLLVEHLTNQNIPLTYSKLLAALTNDVEEALAIFEDDWFAQARNIVIQLNETLLDRPEQMLLLIQTKWLPHFKEKEQVQTGLDLLLFWFKDILYVKLGQEDKTIFIDQIDKIEQLAFQLTEDRLLHQITHILESKKRIDFNVNVQLLMEQLFLQLQEG